MRGSTSKCRQAKRCILFFLAIALLPLLVIYFLISDQMRHVHHMNVSIHKYIGNMCVAPIRRTPRQLARKQTISVYKHKFVRSEDYVI